jgi:hypothetical protein
MPLPAFPHTASDSSRAASLSSPSDSSPEYIPVTTFASREVRPPHCYQVLFFTNRSPLFKKYQSTATSGSAGGKLIHQGPFQKYLTARLCGWGYAKTTIFPRAMGGGRKRLMQGDGHRPRRPSPGARLGSGDGPRVVVATVDLVEDVGPSRRIEGPASV